MASFLGRLAVNTIKYAAIEIAGVVIKNGVDAAKWKWATRSAKAAFNNGTKAALKGDTSLAGKLLDVGVELMQKKHGK